jgi:hypothetical protein
VDLRRQGSPPSTSSRHAVYSLYYSLYSLYYSLYSLYYSLYSLYYSLYQRTKVQILTPEEARGRRQAYVSFLALLVQKYRY